MSAAWVILDLGGSSVLDLFGDEGGCLQQPVGRWPMVNEPHGHAPKASSDERWNALEELDEWLRTPMLVLSFLWLLLVVVELVWGAFDPLETFGAAIWIAFLIEFSVRFALAPKKTLFLTRNWLTVVALIVPAFRLLHAFRILRFTRAA
jgi:voltage-gated potassium channel